jgi:hypothetical protein
MAEDGRTGDAIHEVGYVDPSRGNGGFMKPFSVLSLLAALLVGCTLSGMSWNTQGSGHKKFHPCYRASLEPVKHPRNPEEFGSFLLTVRNEIGGMNLRVDWSRTHYLQNGEKKGHFVSKADLCRGRGLPAPPDVIAPGTTLNREIFPMDLVSVLHEPGGKGPVCETGYLPEGENGILLTVTCGGEQTSEPLSVVLSK